VEAKDSMGLIGLLKSTAGPSVEHSMNPMTPLKKRTVTDMKQKLV
jgi:hypothetical protein